MLAPLFGTISTWNVDTMGPFSQFQEEWLLSEKGLIATLASLFLDQAKGFDIKSFRPISLLDGMHKFLLKFLVCGWWKFLTNWQAHDLDVCQILNMVRNGNECIDAF